MVSISKAWNECKEKALKGLDANSGGLSVINLYGKKYIGGFFMNMLMLFDKERGGFVRFSNTNDDHLYRSTAIDMTDKEYQSIINR